MATVIGAGIVALAILVSLTLVGSVCCRCLLAVVRFTDKKAQLVRVWEETTRTICLDVMFGLASLNILLIWIGVLTGSSG